MSYDPESGTAGGKNRSDLPGSLATLRNRSWIIALVLTLLGEVAAWVLYGEVTPASLLVVGPIAYVSIFGSIRFGVHLSMRMPETLGGHGASMAAGVSSSLGLQQALNTRDRIVGIGLLGVLALGALTAGSWFAGMRSTSRPDVVTWGLFTLLVLNTIRLSYVLRASKLQKRKRSPGADEVRRLIRLAAAAAWVVVADGFAQALAGSFLFLASGQPWRLALFLGLSIATLTLLRLELGRSLRGPIQT